MTTLYYPFSGKVPVSQGFGKTAWADSYKLYGLQGHNGIDFAAVTGTPVGAADDGTVIEAKEERTGYGRHVHIEHSHGVTIYGHLSAMLVRVGDVVKARTVIGKSGGDPSDPFSGNSTGPHLHFEYRPNGESRSKRLRWGGGPRAAASGVEPAAIDARAVQGPG